MSEIELKAIGKVTAVSYDHYPLGKGQHQLVSIKAEADKDLETPEFTVDVAMPHPMGYRVNVGDEFYVTVASVRAIPMRARDFSSQLEAEAPEPDKRSEAQKLADAASYAELERRNAQQLSGDDPMPGPTEVQIDPVPAANIGDPEALIAEAGHPGPKA